MQLIAALSLLPLLALAAPAAPATPAASAAPAAPEKTNLKATKYCRLTGGAVITHLKPTLGSTNMGQLGARGTFTGAVCFTFGDVVGEGAKADDKWLLLDDGHYVTNYYIEESCIDGNGPDNALFYCDF